MDHCGRFAADDPEVRQTPDVPPIPGAWTTMKRLQTELLRLYGPSSAPGLDAQAQAGGLIDASGQVRAMVLELARPANWARIARVWNGVQADLALPAPAIAVSGSDGYQLWFSLASPLPVHQAAAFLEGLRLRYLADLPRQRLALLPAQDDGSPLQARHAARVPAEQPGGGRWSAFVAPDLAPMFAEEPWLDLAPNPDGQAGLLVRLNSITLPDLQQAQARLGPGPAPAAMPAVRAPAADRAERSLAADPADPTDQTGQVLQPTPARLHPGAAGPNVAPGAEVLAAPARLSQDPKQFLLDVMNDDRVDLALRIEAAQALLPYFAPRPGP